MLQIVSTSRNVGTTSRLGNEGLQQTIMARVNLKPPMMTAWARLDPVYRLAARNRIDAAIDEALKVVDPLLTSGRFLDVDELLRVLDVDAVDTDVSVALLMATFPAREHLAHRDDAIGRLAQRLQETEPEEWVQILRHLG